MSLSDAVDTVEWHCSKRVCKHQYILEGEQPDLFKRLNDTLRASMFSEKYLKCIYKVAFIGDFKYWRMGKVINRKPTTEEEAGKIRGRVVFLGEVKLGTEK